MNYIMEAANISSNMV